MLSDLAERHPEAVEAIYAFSRETETASELEERVVELVRIAALIALDGPTISFDAHVGRALKGGVSADDIRGVALAVAPMIGIPRLLKSLPILEASIAMTHNSVPAE